jgi:hypothetical protein
LDIVACAVWGYLFAEQEGAAIAENGKMSELMSGISLGDRVSAVWESVSSEDGGGIWQIRVESQFVCEGTIEDDDARGFGGGGGTGAEEGSGQPCVGMVKAPAVG